MTMRGLVFVAPQEIGLRDDLPKPRIVHDTDAVCRITLCGICGSDLHPFFGKERGIQAGTVVGHEFVGIVEEVGPQVTSLQVGDRVMCPFTACCGKCFYCSRGLTCRCEHPHAALFGWVNEGDQADTPACFGLHGSQAQYVRAPLADGSLVKLPGGVTDDEGVLLGDILPTAFFCAEQGAISAGDTVVVVGCGPVGLLATLAAQHHGAGKVIAVDGVPSRRQLAERFGAAAVEPAAAADAVQSATSGRGADVVLEVVGSNPALQLALELLRPGGTLSSVGVHTEASFPFSPVDGYNKNLTYRSGRCPARRMMAQVLPLVVEKKLPFTDIITHRLPLGSGVEAYAMFSERREGVVKVMLDPWAVDE